MEFKYKFVLKKLVCNKLRNIYIKVNSKSRKQYLKYKGDMIHIAAFKNLKKKIKKGGGDLNFKTLINNIRNAELKDGGIYEEDNISILFQKFQDHYNKKQDVKVNKNFDFLVNLLEYIRDNYHKKEEDKELYDRLKALLFSLEENAITGIYYSVTDDKSVDHSIYKLSIKEFQIVEELINNFSNNNKLYYIKSFFEDKNKITISNTQLLNFIKRVQRDKELRENNNQGSHRSSQQSLQQSLKKRSQQSLQQSSKKRSRQSSYKPSYKRQR